MLSDADGPLLEALSVGRTDIVKKLLEEVRAELNRASPDDPDKQGQSAIGLRSLIFGHFVLSLPEREFRAFLDAPRAGEDTLLHLAVKVQVQLNRSYSKTLCTSQATRSAWLLLQLSNVS